MTKKLLEVERKRQLTSNIEELIKRLQDRGFASAMVLPR